MKSELNASRIVCMLLVYLAWLAVIAMFAAALHALHTVPIYTHGPLERSTQQVCLRRLLVVCGVLGFCACFLLTLHFTVVA